MANICPQAPILNKGFWAKLEAFLRYQHEHNEAFEEMVVITGPVDLPPSRTSIPLNIYFPPTLIFTLSSLVVLFVDMIILGVCTSQIWGC